MTTNQHHRRFEHLATRHWPGMNRDARELLTWARDADPTDTQMTVLRRLHEGLHDGSRPPEA